MCVFLNLTSCCSLNPQTFKSTLQKKYQEESKRHHELFCIEALIGPWSIPLTTVLFRYADVGIKATPHPKLERTVILEAPAMRIDHFLQKVYADIYII